MEPANCPKCAHCARKANFPDWATRGAKGRERRDIVSSIYLNVADGEKANLRMMNHWQKVVEAEVRYQGILPGRCRNLPWSGLAPPDASRFRPSARRAPKASKSACCARSPSTPSRKQALDQLAGRVEGMLVVEMNAGQMLDDVRLASYAAACRLNSTAAWAAWCPSRMKSWLKFTAWLHGPSAAEAAIRTTAGWNAWQIRN